MSVTVWLAIKTYRTCRAATSFAYPKSASSMVRAAMAHTDLEKKNSTGSTSTLHPFEDPAIEDLNIPTRILSNDANLEEYRHETSSGIILQTHVREVDGREEKVQYKLVTFTDGDPENPKNWSKAKKWWCTIMISLVCFTVAFCSAVITADIEGVTETFHVSTEVAFLTITLFVVGFGIGTCCLASLL